MPTSERPVALTTPTVTVWSSPNGLPIAIAHSPTRGVSESPSFATVSSVVGSKRITARSVLVSVPTMRPRNSCLDERRTVTPAGPTPPEELVEEILERRVVGERSGNRRRTPRARHLDRADVHHGRAHALGDVHERRLERVGSARRRA